MQTSRGKIHYDEWGEWPELKYMPDGMIKAKRWWWPPDRKKAKLMTALLNSDTFKKARFLHKKYLGLLPRKYKRPKRTGPIFEGYEIGWNTYREEAITNIGGKSKEDSDK